MRVRTAKFVGSPWTLQREIPRAGPRKRVLVLVSISSLDSSLHSRLHQIFTRVESLGNNPRRDVDLYDRYVRGYTYKHRHTTRTVGMVGILHVRPFRAMSAIAPVSVRLTQRVKCRRIRCHFRWATGVLRYGTPLYYV